MMLILAVPAVAAPVPAPTPVAGLEEQAVIQPAPDGTVQVRFQDDNVTLPVFLQGGQAYLPMGAAEAVRLFSMLGITVRWTEDGRTVTLYGSGHYLRWGLRSDLGCLDGRDVRRPDTLIPGQASGAALSLQALAELLNIRFVPAGADGAYVALPVIEKIELSKDGGDRRILLRATAPFDFLAGSEGTAVRLAIRGVRWGLEERAFHYEDADVTVDGTGTEEDPLAITFQMPEHWRGEVMGRFLLTEAAVRIAPAFRVARDYRPVILSNLRGVHSVGEQWVTVDSTGPLQYFWRFNPDTRMLVVDVPQAQFSGEAQATFQREIQDLEVQRIQSTGLDFVRVRLTVNRGYGFDVRMAEDGRLVLRFAPESQLPITAYTGKGFEPQGGDAGGIVVVIDPGHGGSDPGAVNRWLGIREADITLDISKRLREVLTRRGFKVLMTRESDRDVTWAGSPDHMELGARAEVANRNNASVFVSIHCNSSVSSVHHGTSFHWFKDEDLHLARSLDGSLSSSGVVNRGPIRNRFAVLRRTNMPAVLVETAFISNPSDGRRLADPAFRQKIAEMLADALFAHHVKNAAQQGQVPAGR